MTGQSTTVDRGTGRGWLLAIDTSTEQAGLALYDGEEVIELSWPAGRTQTVSVLPRIDEILAVRGLGIEHVGAVGIAQGPGTFTGLRVGLSVAKGLAIVPGRSLIAVDTLLVAATPFVAAGITTLAVLPAGRRRLVWAEFEQGMPLDPPRNTTLDELLDHLASRSPIVVAGEFLPDQREAMAKAGWQVVSGASGARRPGVLAELAWARWQRGDVADPVTIEPLYLHGKALGGPTGS
jgi:tRNA threonylcarbamoyladenosine biosynthesis protein TsaB